MLRFKSWRSPNSQYCTNQKSEITYSLRWSHHLLKLPQKRTCCFSAFRNSKAQDAQGKFSQHRQISSKETPKKNTSFPALKSGWCLKIEWTIFVTAFLAGFSQEVKVTTLQSRFQGGFRLIQPWWSQIAVSLSDSWLPQKMHSIMASMYLYIYIYTIYIYICIFYVCVCVTIEN